MNADENRVRVLHATCSSFHSRLSETWLLPLLVLTALGAVAGAGWCMARRPKAEDAEEGKEDWFSLLAPVLFAACVVAGALVVWSRHPIRLYSYGLFLVFGFFLAVWGACLEAKRRGYDPNVILDLAMPVLFVSLLFCRLVYIILNPSQFDTPLQLIAVWDGGLSFHGSLIGAPLVIAYFAWRRGIRFATLCDLVAPSVFIGYAFGRLGCFMNGCCYGTACDLPWAMRFPLEGHRGALTLPSHPTQLYSVGLALVLFVWMQKAKTMPRFSRWPGQITLLFFALYAVERAFIEIFRNGATAGTVFGLPWLTEAQFVSALGLAVIAVLWIVLSRRATRNPQSREESPLPTPQMPA